MTSALKALIIFFVIVIAIVGLGGLSNADEQDWQAAQQTTSTAMTWMPVAGCGLFILFIMSMALNTFSSSSSSSSSSSDGPVDDVLKEIPDAAEIDMGGGRHAVRARGRFFIFQQYRGGEASVQEVDRKGRPISGVVYQNKDSYRFGKSPDESLGQYVKEKVISGRPIPK